MVVGILFFVLIGCGLGIVTGLVPGLHVNTVAVLAITFFPGSGFELVALIGSMSIVHSFVDFIPSVMLGIPSQNNLLSVLPGHRFFLKGKGHYAIVLTVWGGMIGGLTTISIFPIFQRFLQKSVEDISLAIPFVLTSVLVLMIWQEKTLKKKAFALAIIFLAATLGVISLSTASNIKNPLLVLILGFFGLAPVLHSIKNKPVAKEQVIENRSVKQKIVLEGALLSALGASFVAMFPGIGPNQAALTIKSLVGKISSSSYLVIIGGINTANIFLSLVVLYTLGKTRTGTAATIKQLMTLEFEHMLALAAVSLIAIGFGAVITIILSKRILPFLIKMDYGKINLLVAAGLGILVLFLLNMLGVIAFTIAALIGYGTIALNIKRSHCMAFLMVPTILSYLAILAN
tara:strand:- start:10235 stop:11440 length:1206 start_codon:yes stop_codon:yes gene_type:complete